MSYWQESAFAAVQVVFAGAASASVPAQTTVEGVAPEAAVEPVTSRTAAEEVGARAAGHGVPAGLTDAADFPTTPEAWHPTDPTPVNEEGEPDGWAARLDPTGSRLAFATYIPVLSDPQLDAEGDLYLTDLPSPNLPMTGPRDAPLKPLIVRISRGAH